MDDDRRSEAEGVAKRGINSPAARAIEDQLHVVVTLETTSCLPYTASCWHHRRRTPCI